MRVLSLLALLAFPTFALAQKDAAIKSAAAHADANWPAALKIWDWAEPGYQEKKSAEELKSERDDLAEGLYPRPPNLAEAARAYTPAELFWIIQHGIRMTAMPSWGDHSDDELWAPVAFIEKLPGIADQEYAKLVASSRAQGGDQHGGQEPQPGSAPQPAAKNYEHPAGPETAQQPGGGGHDHPAGKNTITPRYTGIEGA